MRIGFIGLGIMGKPMAKNLVKAGYHLTVYNRSNASQDELVSFGAEGALSPADVAVRSDLIFTMLPNSPDVEAVVFGKNGILSGGKIRKYYS